MADAKGRNVLPPGLQVPTQAARLLDTIGRIVFLGIAWTLFLTVEDHQSVIFNVGLVVFGYMLYLIYDYRRRLRRSRTVASVPSPEAAGEVAEEDALDPLAMDALEFRNLFLRYLALQGVESPQRVDGGYQARVGGMLWYYGILPPRPDGLVGREAVERQIHHSLAVDAEGVTLVSAGRFDPEAVAAAGKAPLPLRLLSGPEIQQGARRSVGAGAVPAPV